MVRRSWLHLIKIWVIESFRRNWWSTWTLSGRSVRSSFYHCPLHNSVSGSLVLRDVTFKKTSLVTVKVGLCSVEIEGLVIVVSDWLGMRVGR